MGLLVLAAALLAPASPEPQDIAVSEATLRADVEFLASDALRGRPTPSQELRIAARYLRARLQRAGLQPGGDEGDFLYAYRWPQTGVAVEAMGARITAATGDVALEWGRDYFLPRSSFGKRVVAGPLMWAGSTGDLSALDAGTPRGHWLVVEGAEPDGAQLARAESSGARGIVHLGADPSALGFLAQLNRAVIGPRLEDGVRMSRALFPVLHVAPHADASLRALVPEEAAPGTSLAARLTEVCDYGRRDDAELENVGAWWPGSDPELAREVIVLSCHYDHRGVRRDGVVFPGADDASAAAALLAVAETLAARGPLRRSVMFLWCSAGGRHGFGAEAWTRAPSLPAGTRAVFNVHVGPVARNAPTALRYTPGEQHPRHGVLSRTLEGAAPAEGFVLAPADDQWLASDHRHFAENLLLPVLYLTTGTHEDSGKPTDTPESLDYEKLARVAQLLTRLLVELEAQ